MKRFFFLMLLLCLLPQAGLAGDPTVFCLAVNPTGDTVPIYQKTSTKSEKIGDFYVYQPMYWDCWEDDDADGWVKLTEPDAGYIQTKYLEQYQHEASDSPKGQDRLPLVIAGDEIPLMSGRSAKGKIKCTLPKGIELLVLGDCGDMYFVSFRYKYAAGRFDELDGFVHKEDVLATGETHSLFSGDIQRQKVSLFPAEGITGTPVYDSFARDRAGISHAGTITLLQDLGEWSITEWNIVESRFLKEDEDHSMPTAYTRTSNDSSRLLRRFGPEKSTRYNGKYFSGVPVVILAQSGDYTQVALSGTSTTAWFDTDFLTDQQTDRRVQAGVPLETFAATGTMFSSKKLKLAAGTELTLIGSRGKDMLFISKGEEYCISLEALMPINNSGVLEAKTTTRLKMHSSITEGADDDVILIPKGKKVTVLLHGDEYSKIEFDGKIGYVMTKYLKF